MLRHCSTALSVLKNKWFSSTISELLPPKPRGMKMRADINWIIPDIMKKTNNLKKDTLLSHTSPQFFDEKDKKRQCYLKIESCREFYVFEKNVLKLYVWLKQPNESSIATKLAVVVRDEKGQPRQLIYEKTTHSTKIFDNYGCIAGAFEIGNIEEFKSFSTISVQCSVEYNKDDMKESDNPSKLTESSIIDVDQDPMKLLVSSFTENNHSIGDYAKIDLKANDALNYQEASPIIDVDQHSTGLIQQDLEQIFKHQSAIDICFIIGSYRLRAHKLILSARSPVFTAIIKAAEANDNLEDGVEIKNMSFITFKDLIHFIYTDQVFLTERNADSLLAAARKYSIPLLTNKCEEFLYSTSLTVGNCSEKLIGAVDNDNKAVHLKKMVVDFIRLKPAEVMKTNGWTKLKKSHPNLAFEVMEDILKFRAS